MAKLNMKNILFSTLSQEAHLSINKKLLAQVGLELATFIAFLIDKARYHDSNEQLTEDEFFYATDSDIFLFTGLKKTTLAKIKKIGIEKELFFMKKEGIPQKTYYKLNYEMILAFLSVDLSTLELAYNRAFNINTNVDDENKEMVDNLSEEIIYKLSYRDLRLLCKKLKIPYSGNDKKNDLINKILENKGFSQWAEKTPTSGQENCPLVNKKTAHKCTEKLLTSGQKNCTKKNQIGKNQIGKNQIRKNQIEKNDFFENLFKEFNITYTKTNKASVEKLLKTMKQKEVELYLKETYQAIKETPGVKSIARLFSSKISKGERQVLSSKLKKVEKNNDETNNNVKILTFKEKNINISESDDNSDYDVLNFLNSLSKEKQLELENKAIELCANIQNVETKFILGLKKNSPKIYYSSIKKYIKQLLEENKMTSNAI